MKKNKLITLDQAVLKALDFFSIKRPPHFNLKKINFPLVIGSGNAFNTGRALFAEKPAIFADESSLPIIIKKYHFLIKQNLIKQAVIINASGEKDGPWEIKLAKKSGLHTTLLTCTPNSTSTKLADHSIIYDKLPEPYTYNVSTYLGMLFSKTKENPEQILQFLKNLELPKNFKKYKAYAFIVPGEFEELKSLLEVKKGELFGPHLALRAYTYGEARHAKFLNSWDKELVISFGENEYFGKEKSRWEIKLPAKANLCFIMSLAYFLIGKMQSTIPPFFEKNVQNYCLEGPKAYGSDKAFSVIVQ